MTEAEWVSCLLVARGLWPEWEPSTELENLFAETFIRNDPDDLKEAFRHHKLHHDWNRPRVDEVKKELDSIITHRKSNEKRIRMENGEELPKNEPVLGLLFVKYEDGIPVEYRTCSGDPAEIDENGNVLSPWYEKRVNQLLTMLNRTPKGGDPHEGAWMVMTGTPERLEAERKSIVESWWKKTNPPEYDEAKELDDALPF